MRTGVNADCTRACTNTIVRESALKTDSGRKERGREKEREGEREGGETDRRVLLISVSFAAFFSPHRVVLRKAAVGSALVAFSLVLFTSLALSWYFPS